MRSWLRYADFTADQKRALPAGGEQPPDDALIRYSETFIDVLELSSGRVLSRVKTEPFTPFYGWFVGLRDSKIGLWWPNADRESATLRFFEWSMASDSASLPGYQIGIPPTARRLNTESTSASPGQPTREQPP